MGSKLLLIIVFVFDVIAFGLAVAAEQNVSFHDSANEEILFQATIKKNSESNYSYCVYDSDVSTGYGVGAFLFLMLSQILVMKASRCFCCGNLINPSRSRAFALILFVTCWVFFVIAEACLLAGSVRNAYHTKYRAIFAEKPPSCQTVRKGVFATGAAFTILTAVASELYYICFFRARD